ncbi:MAG TPA: hypothetical protein VGE45_11570 [Chloroflexia bacterium]
MVRSLRVFGLVLALLLGLVSFGTASAQSEPTCELVPNVNGTATPGYVRTGESTILVGTGFTPGEAVSFWFTSPKGNVIGTPSPIEGGVAPDGTVGLRLTVTAGFASEGPGRYAITFQGAGSNRTAVIYFCVNSVPPAQPTAVPPTAVPPTAVPPTAVPPTTAPPTTQPTVAPTTAVTPTVEATVAVSPTVHPPIVNPVLPPLPPHFVVGSLAVYDQVLENNSVLVDRVEAPQDGWVVVHESNPDGTIMLPGIIGKTMVKAGASGGFYVMLDKKVENGAKLWPMLHIDAGKIGEYEFPGPDVPVVVNGEIVMVPIIVTNDVVGMPRSGQPGDAGNMMLIVTAVLVGMGLLSLGLLARRQYRTNR